jgi:hypothetical protein
MAQASEKVSAKKMPLLQSVAPHHNEHPVMVGVMLRRGVVGRGTQIVDVPMLAFRKKYKITCKNIKIIHYTKRTMDYLQPIKCARQDQKYIEVHAQAWTRPPRRVQIRLTN